MLFIIVTEGVQQQFADDQKITSFLQRMEILSFEYQDFYLCSQYEKIHSECGIISKSC